MTPPPMNLIGLLGATIARMAIGALWYSPLLFVGAWSKLSGVSIASMSKGMGKAIAVDAVGSFLMAFVLMHAIFYAGARTVPLALAASFANWLGFVAVVQIGSVTYEKKPFGLFVLNAGYQLVTMFVMGAILTVWGLNWQ